MQCVVPLTIFGLIFGLKMLLRMLRLLHAYDNIRSGT